MPTALISSRSFGEISPIGRTILEQAGLEVRRVGAEHRPLDPVKLERIMADEQPDVLIAGAEPIPREVLAASPNLRVVQKHGVGVDNIDLDAATELGIAVGNAPGTNTDAVADLTVGFMLALLRSVVPAAVSTQSGGWERFIGHELGQLTVGVVGTGRIGRSVIQRLSGFGTRVIAFDVYKDVQAAKTLAFRYVEFEDLLRESDIVTLHIPLMPETENLISAQQLCWMKPTALLINIARGELVDEQALAECIRVGGIAGAGVDVFATEPPQSSPLLKLKHVIATPHIGAYTVEAMDAMARSCAETVVAVLNGQCPANVLNPSVLRTGTGTEDGS